MDAHGLYHTDISDVDTTVHKKVFNFNFIERWGFYV